MGRSTESNTIDATRIPDIQKKKYFLRTFDNLRDDEEFIILNTHDTSPLKKFFSYERPGMFDWEYLEEGPQLWKIKIRKKSSELLTIKDLLNINPGAIYVLSQNGIDFYTHAEDSIKTLFDHKRKPFQDVLHECINYESHIFKAIRPDIWSVEFIISFIIENHHLYLHKKLPDLKQLIDHLSNNFGNDYPHLVTLSRTFGQFTEEILEHFKDEEEEVFPSLKDQLKKEKIQEKDRDTIHDHLNWMVEDHFLAGDNLRSIRHICNNFVLKEGDIPGMDILYQELQSLENDFLLHILFENHFLVKAVERELNS